MLVARKPEAAARRLIEALGWAVSCVALQRLVPLNRSFVPHEVNEIAYPRSPISLRSSVGGPSGLLFDVAIRFAVVDAPRERGRPLWQAKTLMYEYRLLDHDERELLVYHWQPGPNYLGPDHPHLHVSASPNAQISAIDRQAIDLDKLHLATGRVSLAAVVRMLITEFRVAPLRPDWAERLERAEHVFQEEAGHTP